MGALRPKQLSRAPDELNPKVGGLERKSQTPGRTFLWRAAGGPCRSAHHAALRPPPAAGDQEYRGADFDLRRQRLFPDLKRTLVKRLSYFRNDSHILWESNNFPFFSQSMGCFQVIVGASKCM